LPLAPLRRLQSVSAHIRAFFSVSSHCLAAASDPVQVAVESQLVGVPLTEIPEHLLKRSRDAKRALGMDVPTEAGAAPAEAPTESANAPAVASSAAPAAGAPVPIPAGDAPPPEPPKPEWIQVAESRQKIPYWVMPVLLFLPIWLIMYVGTLEEPERNEGVLYEGGEVYAEHCAVCHGAGGGGGVGPAFSNGAIIEVFANFEDQAAWIVHGTQGYADSGRDTYGDTNKAVGGSGANMPAFGEELTSEELIYVTFYERIELGGHEEDLKLAEKVFDALDHGELELAEHFAEGTEGDFAAEIGAMFEELILELEEAELAAG